MHSLVDAPEHWTSYWMKMNPGEEARSVMHRHAATEMLVVVQGSVQDSDGAVFRVADVVVYPYGSSQALFSPEGCTPVVVESRPSIVI
ncbi:cupin domain-containing protein [Pseudomonas aeruginosa]|nr:cupin domain-containing protein [Pseudomonas aeruginosa]